MTKPRIPAAATRIPMAQATRMQQAPRIGATHRDRGRARQEARSAAGFKPLHGCCDMVNGSVNVAHQLKKVSGLTGGASLFNMLLEGVGALGKRVEVVLSSAQICGHQDLLVMVDSF